MRRPAQVARIDYFGKIPARADFIKASHNPALVGLLDDWLAEVMNLLTAEPRWKQHYDATRPLHFAFVGTRSRRAIAGHIVASGDASQRRYPFLAMSAIDVDAPEAFLPCSPIVLAPLWCELGRLAAGVLDASEPEPCLQALAAATFTFDAGAVGHGLAFTQFLDGHNVSGLEALLGHTPVRRTILGLGLLLQPVRRSGAHRFSRCPR